MHTYAEALALIERHLDDAHRHVLGSVTDPGRSLPRFKTRSEQAQDQRGLRVLLALLVDAHVGGVPAERLLQASYERIDGATLARADTLIRRRLQGIPETPDQPGPARPAPADGRPPASDPPPARTAPPPARTDPTP